MNLGQPSVQGGAPLPEWDASGMSLAANEKKLIQNEVLRQGKEHLGNQFTPKTLHVDQMDHDFVVLSATWEGSQHEMISEIYIYHVNGDKANQVEFQPTLKQFQEGSILQDKMNELAEGRENFRYEIVSEQPKGTFNVQAKWDEREGTMQRAYAVRENGVVVPMKPAAVFAEGTIFHEFMVQESEGKPDFKYHIVHDGPREKRVDVQWKEEGKVVHQAYLLTQEGARAIGPEGQEAPDVMIRRLARAGLNGQNVQPSHVGRGIKAAPLLEGEKNKGILSRVADWFRTSFLGVLISRIFKPQEIALTSAQRQERAEAALGEMSDWLTAHKGKLTAGIFRIAVPEDVSKRFMAEYKVKVLQSDQGIVIDEQGLREMIENYGDKYGTNFIAGMMKVVVKDLNHNLPMLSPAQLEGLLARFPDPAIDPAQLFDHLRNNLQPDQLAILDSVISYCNSIKDQEAITRMNADNLSITWHPNFMAPTTLDVVKLKQCRALFKQLIEHYDPQDVAYRL